MSAVEEWENHCRDQAWYLDHMHGGELHHHRLALAAIAELQEERRVPAITADAMVDLYPPGWSTGDPDIIATLASDLSNAAEGARDSGRVTILKDQARGTEIAAIVPLSVLNSPPSVPEHLPEIPESDLRVDLYRAPHSNMSALHAGVYQGVRLTHLPTGLTAESAGERSQLQNKANALASLRGQLAGREETP